MDGDRRVDQVAAQGPKPGEDAIFVRASRSRDRRIPKKRSMPASIRYASTRNSRPPRQDARTEAIYVTETLRLNPSFTIKWFRERGVDIPPLNEGLRKAGFAEE